MKHDLIQAVKEMLERHCDVYDIAHKMHLPPDTVQTVIDIIQGTLL